MTVVIGVLALQGDVREHIEAVHRAGGEAVPVRTREEIEAVDGLIIPGGESTTVGKMYRAFRFDAGSAPDARRAQTDFRHVYRDDFVGERDRGQRAAAHRGDGHSRYSAMPLGVRSNSRRGSRGQRHRQLAGARSIHPRAVYSFQPGVEVIAEFAGHPVMVREGHCIAAAFHPELTTDARIHRYFIRMVEEAKKQREQGRQITRRPSGMFARSAEWRYSTSLGAIRKRTVTGLAMFGKRLPTVGTHRNSVSIARSMIGKKLVV